MLRSLTASIVQREVDRETWQSQPIVMRGVNYRARGHSILQDINLQLPYAGCTAVMGFNGAGKSVLLRLMHGMISPSTGEIHWGEITDPTLARKNQAMVFQKPVLLRRSVEANLKFVLKRAGLKGEALADEVQALLQLGR